MRDTRLAADAVRRRLTHEGWSPGQLARRADVAENTVRKLLDGKSWPTTTTLSKIEAAFEWPAGRIEDVANGLHSAEDVVDELPDDTVLPDEEARITEIRHRGFRFVFAPPPDATPEQIRKAEDAVELDTILARLRSAGLDDPE